MNQVATTIEHDGHASVPSRPRAQTYMDILADAVSGGASIETLDKLMGLQERYEQNQARKAFDSAIAAAKAEIPVINKNRTVDFSSQKGRTHYKHEDLAEIARTVDPILAKHGLSYRFRTASPPNEPITVICILSHREGHSEENTLSAGRDDTGNKNSHQAIASAITYLQRYSLKAALGLAAGEDDDAKKASSTAAISAEQLTELERRLKETNADVPMFKEYFDIAEIADLPAERFDAACRLLAKKKAMAS